MKHIQINKYKDKINISATPSWTTGFLETYHMLYKLAIINPRPTMIRL